MFYAPTHMICPTGSVTPVTVMSGKKTSW